VGGYGQGQSDWVWWYGSDQDSGDDAAFDLMFRQTLRDVYDAVGEEPAPWLSVPIIPKTSPPPEREVRGLFMPVIDGTGGEDEWRLAGYYQERGGAMARGQDVIGALYYGYDQRSLYLRVEGVRPWGELGDDVELFVYLGVVLGQEGFPATGVWRVRDVEPEAAQWRCGGAAGDTNHTRIIDLAWPADAVSSQEELLSTYPPSQEPDMDALGPDDFAR